MGMLIHLSPRNQTWLAGQFSATGGLNGKIYGINGGSPEVWITKIYHADFIEPCETQGL